MSISDFYNKKKIFITGHTGFKGSWLCFFLEQMGAETCGYSLEPDNRQRILFESLRIKDFSKNLFEDIRDISKISDAIKKFNPEIIFHLAAQPLVLESYADPLKTFSTNIIGTANLLEASRNSESIKAIINVTSDKCYENLDDKKEYVESDRLGGFDPYSASKSCAEIINQSYQKSFYNDYTKGLSSARAGNVIGGGDFSADRLIPDVIRSIIDNKILSVRNPGATRPWQHVFDVIYGYLLLGKKSYNNPLIFSGSFNFSPGKENCISVEEIMRKIKNLKDIKYEIQENHHHESSFLSLNSEKARSQLNWKNIYNIDNTILIAYEWYNCFINNDDIYNKSLEQYKNYMESVDGKN